MSGTLRARDSSSTCYSKDPTKDSTIQEWFKKLPDIFRSNNPVPEPNPGSPGTRMFGIDRSRNLDKCEPPFQFNLCCQGDSNGDLGPMYSDAFDSDLFVKAEGCYESTCMPFKFINHSFMRV